MLSLERIGVILNGVTGRMGANQHLVRSLLAIRRDGGVRLEGERLAMPELLLVGRNADKLQALAALHGGLRWTTDLETALGDPHYSVYFDAQATPLRFAAVQKAIAAGKHVYCEKPVAQCLEEAVSLYRAAARAGVANGVVMDKLWLPGMVKLRRVLRSGFLGRLLSVRIEFGYWVFSGEHEATQRPSWNYRKRDGGGIILDMFAHWRYLIDHLFAPVRAVSCLGVTHIAQRWDEQGVMYSADAEDAAYATLEAEGGLVCQCNASWCTRVFRKDLLLVQVDGTTGSAVAGLRDCWVQHAAHTPRPVWNPDEAASTDYAADWAPVPDTENYPNAFRAQWELFLRHVCLGSAFPYTLREGAKGVQLAESAYRSDSERRWVEVPPLPE